MSDKIDQKTKVDQNTWFFLRFFSPAHLRPLEAEIEAFKSFLVGGWVDSLIIVSLQVLPFEFLTLNVEY